MNKDYFKNKQKEKYPYKPWQIIVGVLVVLSIIALVGLILYFDSMENNVSLYFTIALVSEIFLLVISTTIREKIAIKKPMGDYTVNRAKVIGCTISSRVTTTGIRKRETKTIFKVMLLINNKKVQTYSKYSIPINNEVTVLVSGKYFKHYYIRIEENNNFNNGNFDYYTNNFNNSNTANEDSSFGDDNIL